MNLEEALATLFETEIQSIQDADELDESTESPALNAREAARGILETFDDAPEYVAEVEGGFLISGNRSAILIGHDGAVVAKSLENGADEDEDDPDEATTSATVGGFRGGGMGGNSRQMGAYSAKGKMLYRGRKKKTYDTTIEGDDDDEEWDEDEDDDLDVDEELDDLLDDDDDDELDEEVIDERTRITADYGNVSLRVDSYGYLKYPEDGKDSPYSHDRLSSVAEDAILSAVLAAKPAFENALRKNLRGSGDLKKYGFSIKESEDESHFTTLYEFVENMVKAAGAAGVLNEGADLLDTFESAAQEGDVARMQDTAKIMCERFGVDEKLIPTPSVGQEPMPPYGTGYMAGKNKRGSAARVKSKIGPFAMEDDNELRERFLDAVADGDWSKFDDADELEEAGQMLGKLFKDPDDYKKQMKPLMQRRLELLGGQSSGTLPAMHLEDVDDDDDDDVLEGKVESAIKAAAAGGADDATIAAAVVKKVPRMKSEEVKKIIKHMRKDGRLGEVETETPTETAYRFIFPKPRIQEFLEIARKAGVADDADVNVGESAVEVYLPEAVAAKIRPFFNGDGIIVEEVELAVAE